MDLRALLVFLTLLGFVLTAGGLIEAAVQARRTLTREALRVRKFHELGEAEQTALESGPDPTDSQWDQHVAQWEAEYRRHDLLRPSFDASAIAPLYEAERVVRLVLGSTVAGTVTALIGLLIGTLASVWSLWI
ncbi:hypothetical protein [Clavibacter sp. VKM Ac-2542]|uniref:hypothetical protein n=1 Tax=Clavibacter sp. VKM Ac-2542 TaxID=2783811 RepID=UPI001889EF6F|nr:hypothetical protein [Clavibacter sp. VKM Ac-2542]MBF4621512.1 hypothetical protein [Clavibacter sp. VKM Ac-2542]